MIQNFLRSAAGGQLVSLAAREEEKAEVEEMEEGEVEWKIEEEERMQDQESIPLQITPKFRGASRR